jgi:hypothetical protein
MAPSGRPDELAATAVEEHGLSRSEDEVARSDPLVECLLNRAPDLVDEAVQVAAPGLEADRASLALYHERDVLEQHQAVQLVGTVVQVRVHLGVRKSALN